MEHADTEDTPLRTREEVLARIRTALGGRAAEIVRYGNESGISTGASGDLGNATQLASALLLQYGMDKEFGLVSMSPDAVLRSPLSGKYLVRINTILEEQLEEAVSRLHACRGTLDELAQALLSRNKLTGEEVEEILRRCLGSDLSTENEER